VHPLAPVCPLKPVVSSCAGVSIRIRERMLADAKSDSGMCVAECHSEAPGGKVGREEGKRAGGDQHGCRLRGQRGQRPRGTGRQ